MDGDVYKRAVDNIDQANASIAAWIAEQEPGNTSSVQELAKYARWLSDLAAARIILIEVSGRGE